MTVRFDDLSDDLQDKIIKLEIEIDELKTAIKVHSWAVYFVFMFLLPAWLIWLLAEPIGRLWHYLF